jgi:hypothetical protein
MSDNILYESEARGTSRPARPTPRQANPRQSGLPTDGPRLVRRRRASDPLGFDKSIIPDGYEYEWKATDVYGQPLLEHQIGLRENHWRAVPASRHPELAPAGAPDIRRPGTLLMERPKYLSEEARMEEITEAMKPLRAKEQLMYGTHSPDEAPRDRRGFINRQYAPGDPVVDDGSYSEP